MPLNSQTSFSDPPATSSIHSTAAVSRKRHIFFLLSIFVYIISFLVMDAIHNTGMAILAVIPVAVAAWMYGALPGCIAALLSIPFNIIMSELVGFDWYQKSVTAGGGIPGSIGIILVGYIIGRTSDLSRRLNRELFEKERIEHELALHRQSLEKMVEEKTVELSASNKELAAREHDLVAGEKRLRSIFEAAVDAIITTNSRGEIIEWNKAAESMYGYSAAEVLGKPVNMLIPERLHDRDIKGMNAALQQGKEHTVYRRIEGYGRRKDGYEFPTEVSLSVWESAGEVFTTGIVRNITEDKKAQEALRESEARLRAIVETAMDAIITTNITGEIINWNKAAEGMFGYAAAEVIGKPVKVLVPERIPFPDSKAWSSALLQASGALVFNRREGVSIRRDGSEFPTEVSQSVWESAGEVFATGIVRDITEDKKAQEALREIEARLRAIVESAADAIITADSTGRIVFWNRGAATIYGYTAEEVIGKSVNMLLPQQKRQREAEKMDAVFHNRGLQESSEGFSVRKDGSEFPVEVTRALWSAGGSTFGTAIVRDITERKKTERDRLLLSSALEQAEENIMIMDPQGTIVYVNPAVIRQMNLPAEKLLGVKAFQPIDSLYDSQFFAGIYAQLLKGGSWKGVLNYKIGGEKTAFIQQALSPVLDAEGKIINILSISRDVTHEQTLEEQLRQSQKMEAIGTLAGGIAHDFNNILAAILGYTELAMLVLPKEGIPAERLRHVISSCDRARSLVKQILTFSRRSPHDTSPVKISSIIKEAVKLLRASVPSTIEIQQDIRAADAVVMADSTQLHQLIVNLCTNAAQAMDDSGGILTIGLHDYLRDTNDMAGCYDLAPGAYVRLTVRDTGPGIAPEIKERIFEPFFTTKAVNKGTGMGLAVAHGIVKSYGGCIYADNETGAGATFHVLLPRIDEELPGYRQAQLPLMPQGAETILYVDDEEAVVQIGHGMLESLGYTVVSTGSSQKALEMFSAEPGRFDCVITDMTMPHIRGDELARRLFELRPGLPIILCTGFSEKISEEQALQMGIQAFLLKPFTMQDLGLAVRKALDGGQHAEVFV